MLWPMPAIRGVSWVSSASQLIALVIKGVAVLTFMALGLNTIRNADRKIDTGTQLTPPGALAGFVAGVLVIFGNPRAVLFHTGNLPGFFGLPAVSAADIIAIVALSQLVPLLDNLGLAVMVGCPGARPAVLAADAALYQSGLRRVAFRDPAGAALCPTQRRSNPQSTPATRSPRRANGALSESRPRRLR